jgi:hypothetical protein
MGWGGVGEKGRMHTYPSMQWFWFWMDTHLHHALPQWHLAPRVPGQTVHDPAADVRWALAFWLGLVPGLHFFSILHPIVGLSAHVLWAGGRNPHAWVSEHAFVKKKQECGQQNWPSTLCPCPHSRPTSETTC